MPAILFRDDAQNSAASRAKCFNYLYIPKSKSKRTSKAYCNRDEINVLLELIGNIVMVDKMKNRITNLRQN